MWLQGIIQALKLDKFVDKYNPRADPENMIVYVAILFLKLCLILGGMILPMLLMYDLSRKRYVTTLVVALALTWGVVGFHLAGYIPQTVDIVLLYFLSGVIFGLAIISWLLWYKVTNPGFLKSVLSTSTSVLIAFAVGCSVIFYAQLILLIL